MKTAEVKVPFIFGKAEMTCPYCNHTTRHDREFQGRNGGTELSCVQCQKTFKVPKEFWPSHATVSESPRVSEERIGFLGWGGIATKVRCPYCKQDNEREQGFGDSHAGHQMRCDHCRDILTLPGKPAPKPKPPIVTQPPKPVYPQTSYTQPPAPKHWVTCQHCSGKGLVFKQGDKYCRGCGGAGYTSAGKYKAPDGNVYTSSFKCTTCNGTGGEARIYAITCGNCQGKGGWHQ